MKEAVLLRNLYHTVTTTQLGVMLGDSVGAGDRVALLISVAAWARRGAPKGE